MTEFTIKTIYNIRISLLVCPSGGLHSMKFYANSILRVFFYYYQQILTFNIYIYNMHILKSFTRALNLKWKGVDY